MGQIVEMRDYNRKSGSTDTVLTDRIATVFVLPVVQVERFPDRPRPKRTPIAKILPPIFLSPPKV